MNQAIPLLTLEAPARIHISLLNESGLYGRIDGGIGFAIDAPKWIINVYKSKDNSRNFDKSSIVEQTLKILGEKYESARTIDIQVKSGLDAHIGLGSKTSLVLAISQIICRLENIPYDPIQMADMLQRGGTSGVGVHLSDKGGFVWDAGRNYPKDKSRFGPSSSALARPPALLIRQDISWLKVIHFRVAEKGIYGIRESEIFEKKCPIPKEETSAIINITASQILPSLVEKDEQLLQTGIINLQNLGLKCVEWEHQDEVTRNFRKHWIKTGQQKALGLSSMGPTMYVLTSEIDETYRAILESGFELLHLTATSIANTGATFK